MQAAIKLWGSIKTKCQGNYSYKVSFSVGLGLAMRQLSWLKTIKLLSVTTVRLIVPKPVLPVRGLFLHLKASTTWKKDLKTEKNKGAPVKTLDELYQIALATAKKPLNNSNAVSFVMINRAYWFLVILWIVGLLMIPLAMTVVSSITLARMTRRIRRPWVSCGLLEFMP